MRKVRTQCVYCGGPGDTRDHAPPRTLLERPYPRDLYTVRACSPCNRGFAADEEYFITVLSQIATARTLTSRINPGGSIDRALARAPGLDQRIIDSLVVGRDGRVLLQPELARMHRIVAKLAFGLFIRRYHVVPRPEDVQPLGVLPYNIDDQRPTPLFVLAFTERFQAKRWTHVQKGVFSYLVVRDGASNNDLLWIMDLHRTVWAVAKIPNPQARRPRPSTFWPAGASA